MKLIQNFIFSQASHLTKSDKSGDRESNGDYSLNYLAIR